MQLAGAGHRVRSEEPTEMDRLGTPNVRRPVVITPGDTAAAAGESSAAAGS